VQNVARRVRDSSAAFTLLEIMLVLAVIGLLAAIAIPCIFKARDAVWETRARNDLRVIANAIEQLAFDTGQWPGGIPAYRAGVPEVWNLNAASAGIAASDERFSKWRGPYMKRVGKDPWGSDYFFDPDYRTRKGTKAVVGSFGPNKRGRNEYDPDDVCVTLPLQ
jgi:general secretion pathway protein G